MLLDSWQEHDLLECVAKAAPGNAEEDPRQQHRKSIPNQNTNKPNCVRTADAIKTVFNVFAHIVRIKGLLWQKTKKNLSCQANS